MAILLVQILDSQTKIKLVLIIITALGIVSTYRCWEQYPENEHLIETYEKNPDATLAQHRIVQNSLEHFQFEHRLYSKDISGFFTTSNSAGSFLLMAFFAAVVIFVERYKNLKHDSLEIAWLIMRGVAAIIVALGLILTKSKGAILASIFSVIMFTIYLYINKWLKTHKKAILTACLLLVISGSCIITQYGLSHGRLPGGNSMLVRWQYWQASIKMYADHLLTGIGPGNFAHFYSHYKPAPASESVADPHNFLLSILTQYGPFGLLGFLAMICLPLWIVSSNKFTNRPLNSYQPESTFKLYAIFIVIISSAFLLFIRPVIFPLDATASSQERLAGIIIMYIMPAIIFIAGFLLTAAGETVKIPYSNFSAAALFCAVFGVTFHNLIDFAIFEPGVFTVFWVLIACMIAIFSQIYPLPQIVLKPSRFVKIISVLTGLILICIHLNYVLIPVSKTSAKIQLANRAISSGRFEQAHRLLDSASEDDSFSSAALSLNSKLYLHRFKLTSGINRDLLKAAEKDSLIAIKRNGASFKNYERLTEIYCLLADISKDQEKINWLTKAYDNTLFTAEHLYPGCARLRIELAKISELLGKTDIAITQYEKAIEIEDEYRIQFKEMYPDRKEIVSRLGNQKYQFAKNRLNDLVK
ncbi:MAG: O-antigen ligase family protein [Sedimentisphaerales bacterium]|nr:O-antigen ligase family protein [Sedimentisphaerales bacterium]